MKKYLLIIISILAAVSAGAKDYSVSSPGGHLTAEVLSFSPVR